MTIELTIPEVGESITEAQIVQWLKSEGDRVSKDETVAELETDKVTVDLPAPRDGVLSKQLKGEGETAEVGEVVAHIEPAGGGDQGDDGDEQKEGAEEKERGQRQEEQPEPREGGDEGGEEPEREEALGTEAEQERAEGSEGKRESDEGRKREEKDASAQKHRAAEKEKEGSDSEDEADEEDESLPPPEQVEVRPRVMPAAQRALSKHGLSEDEVEATGPGGRLLKEDVERHVEGESSEASEQKTGQRRPQTRGDGRGEKAVALTPIRKRIAQRLVQAQQEQALLTTFNEVDMTTVKQLRAQHGEAFAAKHGVKLGITCFFVKAVVAALEAFPELNAELRDDQLVYRNHVDIGIAMNSDKGLLVPVVRDAQALSIPDIERAIDDFARRAGEGKIKLEELRGGTFTLTNGGIFGSLLSTPIVDPPQSGVLGMHAIQDRPVARDDQAVIRPMMYIALTYDHRVVDGREAVTFLRRVKEYVETPDRLLLQV